MKVPQVPARAIPAAVFAAALLLHWLEGRGIQTAWLLPDELQAAQAGRAAAGRGGGSGWTLYDLVTAPLWLLGPGAGYAAVKVLGAVLVSAVAFPTYALARRGARIWPSALAAAAAVAAPASVFASAVSPVTLAYPLVALATLAAVRALDGEAPWIVVAVAAGGAAVWAWPAAAFPVLALAVASGACALGGRLLVWPSAGVFVVLAGVLYAGFYGLEPHSDTLRAASDAGLGRAAAAALAGAGTLALGLALLPFAAGLAAARRRGRDGALALAVLLGSAIGSGVLAQAHALSGRPADERCLLLAVPALLALAAATLGRAAHRVDVVAAAIVTAVCVGFAEGVHWQSEPPHAPGLALAKPLGLAPWELALFLVAAASAVAFAVGLTGRRAAAASAVAVGVVAAALATQVAAAAHAASRADALARTLPTPRRLPGGEGARGLVAVTTDPASIGELRFWNPRLETLSPPLAERTLDPATGSYSPGLSAATLYLAPHGAVAGTILRRTAAGDVVRPADPVRAAQTIEGVYPDGWTGARAVYRRFDVTGPGRIRVLLSRVAWGGPDVATGVRVLVGPVGGSATKTVRVRVHAKKEVVLELATPSVPFAAEIDSETFSPSAFGQTDSRTLGVQARFDYRPGR